MPAKDSSRPPDSTAVPSACPDGGTCHHECPLGDGITYQYGLPCFRVLTCEPLSIAGYRDDQWPPEVLAQHRIAQQNEDPEPEEPERTSPIESGHTCRMKWGENYRCQNASEYVIYPQRLSVLKIDHDGDLYACASHIGAVIEQSGLKPHHWQLVPRG